MHGLGDQLYLDVALRALQQRFSTLSITVVKSTIASVAQWHSYIFGDEGVVAAEAPVSASDMAAYDYYVDAEHFAHIPDYKGVYPPVFYLKYLFQQGPALLTEASPKIFWKQEEAGAVSMPIAALRQQVTKIAKPVVFVSSVTTGRVRDLSIRTLTDFIELANPSYTLIVSTYKRPDLDQLLDELELPDIIPTADMVKSPEDLLAIIALADLVITTDSGISHLAETLSKPCGSVFNVVTPEERVEPYRYSESMMVDFEIPSVCKTPCYVHALREGDLCPGMQFMNEQAGRQLYYEYPPCMENLTGQHLMLLLDALIEKFS